MTTRCIAARRARARRRRRGYTLVEVMIAIAILIFGVLSVLGLHRLTMRGNMQAREMTTATQIASTWLDRLQMDTAGFEYFPTTQTHSFTGTRWLSDATVPAVGTAPRWFVPTRALDGSGPTFDYFGRDTTAAADMYYCVNLRFQWVMRNQAIRADVRVWWLRSGTTVDSTGLTSCGAGTDPETIGLRAPRDIHAVYGTSIVRWAPRGGAV